MTPDLEKTCLAIELKIAELTKSHLELEAELKPI